jgi:ammonium transporter, Amt family
MNYAVASSPLTETGFVLTLAMMMVTPLAIAGLALVNTGLGRSRSAAQSLLGSMAVAVAAMLTFAAVGGAWHAFGAQSSAGFFLSGFNSLDGRGQLGVAFEMMTAGFAALIPWGAGADRLRLRGGVVIAVLMGGVIVPLMAGASWGGGWLSALGTRFALGAGFIDAGGSGVVHALGGFTALAMIWVVGARKGKFPKPGVATAIPGHHAVYVLFGCLLALVGWIGVNGAGALLWLSLPVTGLPVVLLNTVLTASAAAMTTFTVTRVRFGKPDASLCANGWLSGLVASSAGVGLWTPAQAIVVGLIAGLVTPLIVEMLELALSIDDPSGAIPVHAVGGVIGIFAAGVFSARQGQLVAQMVGIGTILGLVLPVVYVLFLVVNKVLPFRVDADGERLGMDMHELGGGAYPEFVLHRDDSYR